MYNTKSNGYNILHHACANNFYDLAVNALKSQPQLIHSKDNYGRTPIFWAIWKGAWQIALLLVANKSNIDQQDEVGDTILHIAAEKNKAEEIKKILFYILKNDNEVRSNARVVLNLLHTKNQKGYTAFDIAEELEDESMLKVLKGIELSCNERIEEVEKFVFVQDVTMRSGKLNGKRLSTLDPNLVGSKLEFFEEGLILAFNKKDGRVLRVEMEYNNFAFLILETEQTKIEITLTKSPAVKIQQDGLWKESTSNIFTEGLSFHCNLFREKDLYKIKKIIDETKVLTQFQEMCYCFKNSNVSNSNKDTIELNVDKQMVNKISALRQKLSQMNFGEKTVENENTSTKNESEIVN